MNGMGAVGLMSPNPRAGSKRVHAELNRATRAILDIGRELAGAEDTPRLRRLRDHVTLATGAVQRLRGELLVSLDVHDLGAGQSPVIQQAAATGFARPCWHNMSPLLPIKVLISCALTHRALGCHWCVWGGEGWGRGGGGQW